MEKKTLSTYTSEGPDDKIYQVLDFVENEQFRLWVKEPDNNPMLNIFWENWCTTHPQNIAVIEEAKEILLAIKNDNQHDHQSQQKQDDVWQKLKNRINK